MARFKFIGAFLCLALWVSWPARAWAEENAAAKWIVGPSQAALSDCGQLLLPAGYRFAEREEARPYFDAAQISVQGTHIGVILPPLQGCAEAGGDWYILLSYSAAGHIAPVSSGGFNAAACDAALDALRAGNHQANRIRRHQGWPRLTVVDWQERPVYRAASHLLTWSLRDSIVDQPVVNFNGRVLGRDGFISADMVVPVGRASVEGARFENLVSGISFLPGKRFEDFRAGDHIATGDLLQLIAPGSPSAEKVAHARVPLLNVFEIIIAAFSAATMVKIRTILIRRSPGSSSAPIG